PGLPADIKPLVDMLQKPLSTFDPQQFTGAIAESRPELYKRLAEQITTGELPAHLEKALTNLEHYSPEQQQAISRGVERYIESQVERLTGQRLSGDQIAQIVSNSLRNGYEAFAPVALTYEIADQLELPLDPSDPRHQQFWLQMQYRDWDNRRQITEMNASFEKRYKDAEQAKRQEEAGKVDSQLAQVKNQMSQRLDIPLADVESKIN